MFYNQMFRASTASNTRFVKNLRNFIKIFQCRKTKNLSTRLSLAVSAPFHRTVFSKSTNARHGNGRKEKLFLSARNSSASPKIGKASF